MIKHFVNEIATDQHGEYWTCSCDPTRWHGPVDSWKQSVAVHRWRAAGPISGVVEPIDPDWRAVDPQAGPATTATIECSAPSGRPPTLCNAEETA